MSGALELVATAARTPVGLSARASAAAVRAGVSRLREFAFASKTGVPFVLGTDALLDDAALGLTRLLAMLESVLAQVLDEVGEQLAALPETCNVALVLPEDRPGFTSDDVEVLSAATRTQLARRGVAARITTDLRGHAGGLAAIHRAAARKDAPVALVVGLDSHHHADTLLWLESQQRLAVPGLPAGFKPGEAAAALMLTTTTVRKSWRRRPLARVVGTGVAQEPRLRDSDTGSLGVALARAVGDAAVALSLPDEAADVVYCDLNGERYRSEEWGFFALRCHRALRSLDYHAPCGSWGDVGAAFGPLAAILAVEDFHHRRTPRARALIMAGSDAGQRSAVFLEPPGAFA